jgi:hypothetical protein
MGIFRRHRDTTGGKTKIGKVLNADNSLAGFWLPQADLAENKELIWVLAHREGRPDLVGAPTEVQANEADDRGGVFVLFTDRPQEPDRGESRTLLVNGVPHRLHEDIEAFAAEAAEGRSALLRITMDGPSREIESRLYQVLAARFGPSSPQAYAVVKAGYYCTSCMRGYTGTAGWIRREQAAGIPIAGTASTREGKRRFEQFMAAKGCETCGGTEGAWLYVPPTPD